MSTVAPCTLEKFLDGESSAALEAEYTPQLHRLHEQFKIAVSPDAWKLYLEIDALRGSMLIDNVEAAIAFGVVER